MARPNIEPGQIVPLDELQGIAEEAQVSPAPRIAVQDVTGGNLAAQAVQVQRQREATLEGMIEVEQRSFGDILGAVVGESTTAHIARKVAEEQNADFWEIDPDFDAVSAVNKVVDESGLEPTDELLERLGQAGSEAELMFLTGEAKDSQERMRILGQHGKTAFALSLLDPTELLVDIAAFGATKWLKFGRAASAAAGSVATTAPLAAADASGKDVDMTTYVMSAALGAGAFSLFGGEAANRIARGEANWYGKLHKPTGVDPGKVTAKFNEFFSEYDRLYMPDKAGAKSTRVEYVNAKGEKVVENFDGRDVLLGKIADDPVRRTGTFSNNNAASFARRDANEIQGYKKKYDDAVEAALKEEGYGWVSRRFDPSGKYGEARDGLEKQLSEELLRRQWYWDTYGGKRAAPRTDERIAKLADEHDNMMNRVGEMSRDAGVAGMEDFIPHPGYFHRSWSPDKLVRMGPKASKEMIVQAAMKGIRDLDTESAELIATGIFDRAAAKFSGKDVEFFGALGKTDTDMIRAMLQDSGEISAARIEGVMRRIENSVGEGSKVKYAKSRLPLDMTHQMTLEDGTILKMSDLIDTDLGRLASNYNDSMVGRTALAKAGVGRSDAELEAFKDAYIATMKDMPSEVRTERTRLLEDLIGDFTGNIRDANRLDQGLARVKSIADSTMLAASGLWQGAEYATMAHRYGLATTTSEFLKQFPGVGGILRKAGRNPDLRDELESVLQLDLARDIRVRPWQRQHEAHLTSADTVGDRFLHMGKQAVPYLNGMKYVHKHQARMNANLAVNKIARAAKGDKKAVQMLEQYGLKGPELERVLKAASGNATYKGKNAQSMNWGAWVQSDVDSAMNVAIRMMDDATLFGRAGQGGGGFLLGRSATAQVLGQFRSFVTFAHNKLLRGTLEHQGAGGLATLLAFQYPLTGLMVTVNEARKGDLDLSEDGIKEIAMKTVGYTAGLGFAADAFGVAGGGSRGGLSVPATGVFDVIPRTASGVAKIGGGEFRDGAADITKAMTAITPAVSLLPGTALAVDALRGE